MASPESLFENPEAIEAGKILVAGYLEIALDEFSGMAQTLASQVRLQIAHFRYPEFEHFTLDTLDDPTTPSTRRSREYGKLLVRGQRLANEAHSFQDAKLAAAQSVSNLVTQEYDGKEFEIRIGLDEDDSFQTEKDRKARRDTRYGIIEPTTPDMAAEGLLRVTYFNKTLAGEKFAPHVGKLTLVQPNLLPKYELAVAV